MHKTPTVKVKVMTDDHALKFTNEVFSLIKNSKSISDLENIPGKFGKLAMKGISIEDYPKIEFSISISEIQSLLENELIDRDLKLAKNISSKINDPLSKLLYAIVWKNGDLKKIRHIIKGILNSESENDDQEEALVFYQFGKYLTKIPGQPIIDQHVIRAFAVYNSKDISRMKSLRQIQKLDKDHNDFIKWYKEWLVSDALTTELRRETDYSYHIDKLLFATGKTIKTQVKKKS